MIFKNAGILVFLAIISAPRSLATDPTVEITESEPPDEDGDGIIYSERDRDVTLSCYIENLQEDTQVRWVRVSKDSTGKEAVTDISTGTSIKDNTKYSIDKPTTLTWRLRIKNVRESDEARYRCYVQTTMTNKKESVITLVVQIRPYFDLERISSDKQVKAGTNVLLQCHAYGRPTPVVEWMRLGGQLLPIGKERHREADLEIIDVQPEDRGEYRCRVDNPVGTITRSIKLDVTFQPIIQVQNPQVYQAPGYRMELQCFVEANPFPNDEEIAWLKGSLPITSSSDRYKVNAIRGAFNRLSYELIIHSVREDDYGTYKCQIQNIQGTRSGQVQLMQTDIPQPSVKLGRIVAGSSALKYGLVTIVSLLLSLLCYL